MYILHKWQYTTRFTSTKWTSKCKFYYGLEPIEKYDAISWFLDMLSKLNQILCVVLTTIKYLRLETVRYD